MLTISVTRIHGDPDDGVRVWLEADGYEQSHTRMVCRRTVWSAEEYENELARVAGDVAAEELRQYRRQQ